MMTFFIIVQFILLIFMLFHDWIPISPWNDIPTLRLKDGFFYRALSSVINGAAVLIPLLITWKYHRTILPLSAAIEITAFYVLLTIGTIFSWWVPYIFGSSEKHKQQFSKFKNTHHFLPPRQDHVVPNTLHVILHLQVWACLVISIYFLMMTLWHP